MGGALVMVCPAMHPLERLCYAHKAVVVCPVYCSSVDAPYPAGINDVHAGDIWILAHAEELASTRIASPSPAAAPAQTWLWR